MTMLSALHNQTELADFIPDREIGFDFSMSNLDLVKGEFVLKKFPTVEDRKGNPGIFGDLVVTNLRIIWLQDRQPRINLSIGYNTFVKMALVPQDLHNDCEHVQIKALHNDSRYEFFFFRKKSSKDTFDVLPRVCNAYDGSRGYREIFIRKIVSQNDHLILYEREKIINQYQNVWNLGKNEGKLGRFYFTNVRIVWISNTNENFNISVPYTRILKLVKKNSNFGDAIGMQTSKAFGGLDIGFKIDAVDYNIVLEEMKNLWDTYRNNPFQGIPENISAEVDTSYKTLKKSYFMESEVLDVGYNEDQNIRAIYREDTASEVDRSH